MTQLLCSNCKGWEVSPEDVYCSFCGHLQLSLEVTPHELLLINDLAPKKQITLTHTGREAFDLQLETPSHIRWLDFQPKGKISMSPGQQKTIHFSLHGDRLTKAFDSCTLNGIVNGDPRRKIQIQVEAKLGPLPVAISPELVFGEVEEGKVAHAKTVIQNRGGTPLKFKRAEIEGVSEMRVEENLEDILLNPQQKQELTINWPNPKRGQDSQGLLRLSFSNYKKPLEIPIKSLVYQFDLVASPNIINISPVLSKSDRLEEITLTNRGSRPVEITGIESSVPWAIVINKPELLTLTPVGPNHNDDNSGKHVFKLLLKPQELEAGEQKAHITVRTANDGQELQIPIRLDVLKPKPYLPYIGIDFGTSNSVVALWDNNTFDLVQDSDDKKNPTNLIPSLLVFDGGPDHYLIGQKALNIAQSRPHHTVRSIKRVMGYGNHREFFGRKFTPEDLAAIIIRQLINLTEQRIYEQKRTYYDIRKAIITVPANFFDLQIRGLLKACRMAGIDTEEEHEAQEIRRHIDDYIAKEGDYHGIILDEPVAAALFYLDHLESKGLQIESKGLPSSSKNSDGPEKNQLLRDILATKIEAGEPAHFLIYDHGGGTVDISIVRLAFINEDKSGLNILASKGNNSSGGDSIDLLILKHLLEKLKLKKDFPALDKFNTDLILTNYDELDRLRKQEKWPTAVWKDIWVARNKWKELAEKLKIHLGSAKNPNGLCRFDGGIMIYFQEGQLIRFQGKHELSVSQEEFVSWVKPIIDDCTNLAESTLTQAQLSPNDIDFVIHTGRSSHIQEIRNRISSIFPNLAKDRDLFQVDHLKVCVAKGAALYGMLKNLDDQSGVVFMKGSRRLPHAYGIAKRVGYTQLAFEPVIELGSEYPIMKEVSISDLMSSKKKMVQLQFYQNSGFDNIIQGNTSIRLIGGVSLNPKDLDEQTASIKFMIDHNRQLTVMAGGKKVEIQIEPLKDDVGWM